MLKQKISPPAFPLLRRLSTTAAAAGFSLNLPKLEPSNDAELISQILVTNHNPFHFTESSLQLNGISLSPHLINQTLLRLRHNSKIALSFFQWTNYVALQFRFLEEWMEIQRKGCVNVNLQC
ncbi:hypothetical protein F2Q70_00030562 [Brassica cretica]|uniref:Uncharacterized protein n=1 Tax=Brassica cretica TaxID=69181 RepID=A0A8S9FCH4_BRACR|nr:hypothetical protein F2Q70_00030562 [Brassica cretica]